MQELHVFCYDSARVVLRSQPRALASSAGAFKRPPVVADFSLDGALPCMLCSVHLKSGPAGVRAKARTLGRVTLPALVAEHGARGAMSSSPATCVFSFPLRFSPRMGD